MRVAVIAVALVFASVSLHADYRDAFRDGIRAQRRGEWQAAARAMREAIRERATDTGQNINIAGFGDNVPYTPNYWLGVALFNLRDCPGALAAWELSDTQGGLRRVSARARADVAKYRQECGTQVAALDRPPSPEKPAVTDGVTVSSGVHTAASGASSGTTSGPVSGVVSGAVRSADPMAEPSAASTPGGPVRPAAPVPPAAAAASSAESITAVTRGFTPPADLAAAARLLFSARYREAAASLARQRYSPGPAAGHAALLRAATQYSLYLVGGEREPSLLEQARQASAEARRLAPALQPDPRAFSPRFLQFFAAEARR